MRNNIPLLLLVALLTGCGGSGGGGEGEDSRQPQDAPAGEPEIVTLDGADDSVGEPFGPEDNGYRVTILVEKGPGVTCETDEACEFGTCCRFELERLELAAQKFAFGSTHIAPAVSLAMTDNVYNPFMGSVKINVGVIVGTSDNPPHVSKKGLYQFSSFEPSVMIYLANKDFSSKEAGAEGSIDVTDWSSEEGGIFAGTFNGVLVQVADKDDLLRMQVSGEFHFILPPLQGGQPGG